jgi:hypothetical protein
MRSENSKGLAFVEWNGAEGTVDNHEPIAIRLGFNAAKDLPPGEIALTEEIGRDDALVKSPPLRVFRGRRVVKGMAVAQEYGYRPVFEVSNDFHGECAKARNVFSQQVLVPSNNGQGFPLRIGGNRRGEQMRDPCMGSDPKTVIEVDLSGGSGNHAREMERHTPPPSGL